MEDMQQMPTAGKPSNAMHSVIILMLSIILLVVLVIAYFTYGFVITIEQAREMQGLQTTALDRIEAKLSAEPSETATQPTQPTETDVVLYKNDDFRIRVVTRKACESVFKAIKSNELSEGPFTFYDAFGVFVPNAQDWPKDSATAHYKIMNSIDIDRLNKYFTDNEMLSSVSEKLFAGPYTSTYQGSTQKSVVQYPVHDAPSDRDLMGTDGQHCTYYLQNIP